MGSETISARFSEDLIRKIDKLVDSGDFGSRGEFVQYAVRKILKQAEEGKNRFPPPLIKWPGGRSTSAGWGLRAA